MLAARWRFRWAEAHGSSRFLAKLAASGCDLVQHAVAGLDRALQFQSGKKPKKWDKECTRSEAYDADLIVNAVKSGRLDAKLAPYLRDRTHIAALVMSRLEHAQEAVSFFVWAAKQPGFRHDIDSSNQLLDTLCRCGRSLDALAIFKKRFCRIFKPNATTYTMLVRGLCHARLMDEACERELAAARGVSSSRLAEAGERSDLSCSPSGKRADQAPNEQEATPGATSNVKPDVLKEPPEQPATSTFFIPDQREEETSPEGADSYQDTGDNTDASKLQVAKLAICGVKDEIEPALENEGEKTLRTSKTFRGGRRRCLDFQSNSQESNAESLKCLVSPDASASILPEDTTYTTTPTTTSEPESLTTIVDRFSDPGHVDACKRLMRESGPSGVGLHLNSLGILTAPRGVSLQSLVSCSQEMQDADGFVPAQLRLVSVVEKTRMDQHVQGTSGSQESLVTSTTCVRSLTLGIQALEESVPFGIEQVLTPGRKRLSVQGDSLDCEPVGRTPKKKRKSLGEKAGDGCKRCHCKKSKCLKLYCECFAAGVYCLDSCACRDCFNKPEFADTVMGTRQQIETRNPLAFAPKIVQSSDSTPTERANCPDTTASARHKRGCNCKKSLCLKKYCECYQAGVGCSDGCKCNGCKNIYGVKKAQDEAELEEPLQPNNSSITSLSPITPTLIQHASAIVPCDSTNTPSSTTPATSVSKLMDPSNLQWDETPEFLRAGHSSPRTMLNDLLSEETPEFLRMDERSSPRTGIKGSPKQKRVAPPNAGQLAGASSSSSLLKSGRKLTLQSLPSLPPVTPFSFAQQPHQPYKRS